MAKYRARHKASTFLTVEPCSTAELNLKFKNPRGHSRDQICKIARSIQAFGFNVPVLIDRDKNVIAGHARLLACQKLGWTEVPAIRLEHLSDAQARAFMIADNRLSEIAVWDERLLAEQLKELSILDLDFELEDIGFEMAEIDLKIEGLNGQPDGTDDPADVVRRRLQRHRSAGWEIFGYSAAIAFCVETRWTRPPIRR